MAAKPKEKPPASKKAPPAQAPAQARRPQARPLPAAKPTAADEYAHDDTDFDPDLDQEPAREAPPRGEGGRFVSPAEVEVEKPKPAHPSGLLSLAQRFGLTDAEIERTPTPELSNIVAHLTSQALAERERSTFGRDVREAVAGEVRALLPLPEDDPALRQPETRRQPPRDPDEFALNYEDEGAYDPQLLRENKRMAAELTTLRKQLKDLAVKVDTLGQREVARVNETRNQRIDRLFGSLGEEFHDIVGTGAGLELAKSDPEKFARRVAVLRAAEAIDKKLPDEAFHKALKTLFGFQAKPRAEAERAPARPAAPAANGRISEEDWNGGSLSLPSQREIEEPRGTPRAARAVARKMRDMGLTEDDMLGVEEVGMPD